METPGIENFIILAILAMSALGAIILFFQLYYNSQRYKIEKEKQIAAFRAAVEAEERQKEKTARNLHDEAITILTVSGRNIEEYLNTFENKDKLPKSLISAKKLIDNSISGIRAIALDLIPNTFFNFGLIKALELYLTGVNENTDSDAELAIGFEFDINVLFSKTDQINIYRICLELISNLNKYAHYTYLRVSIDKKAKFILVVFEHDGRGITNEDIKTLRNSSSGLGLRSLDARLLLLNATLNYITSVDTSKIELNLPFKT